MLSQLDQVSKDSRDNTILVLRPSLLNYKLNHVVLWYSLISEVAFLELEKTYTVLVLHKIDSKVMHGLKQRYGVFFGKMFKTPLENTAAVRMS